MSFATGLRCRKCGQGYPLRPINLCDFCFSPLEVAYDYKLMSKQVTREMIASGPINMWRYGDLLPVEGQVVDIGAGFTPLLRGNNLGQTLGLDQLYIKNDCVNPTYSFKDRAVAVAIAKACEFGFDTVACASTGNLAASVAAHAAKARLRAFVFVPADTEQGKFIGTAVYNPTIVAVEGSYDRVNRLCSRIAEVYDWGFININLRPYYAEGSKTLGYEIAEQLGWRSPDHVITPSASGLLFTRIWKGLNELAILGLISPIDTRMHLVQAAGSAPIVNAFDAGTLHVHPVEPATIAKSIAVGNPADGHYALKTARESGGSAQAVTDEEIIEGMKLLARTEGIFAETAGGAVIAGLQKMVRSGIIKRDALTVVCITGAGLKTQEVVSSAVQPIVIRPTLECFEEALQNRDKTTANVS